ncbi:MAG: hypothetical protein N3B01_02110 [Verrucomicrobiae bacterium]|nr:hypothetical protein [Verrucomicrobiae bacterium]
MFGWLQECNLVREDAVATWVTMKTDLPSEKLFAQTFARLDAVAFGIALGVVGGAGLFAATAILLIKGGENMGQNLRLLAQYFPGYRVSWAGAFVGFGYGFLTGYVAGWLLATVRNAVLWLYLLKVKMKAASVSFRGFFDNL